MKLHTLYASEQPGFAESEEIFTYALSCTLNYMSSFYALSADITRAKVVKGTPKQLQRKPITAERCGEIFR